MIDLSPEAWGALATIGGATATALGAWAVARSGRTGRVAEGARAAAEEARELARPTGNGFAGEVTTSLASLADAIERIERRQEAEAVSSRKAAELLAEHLNDHAQAGIGSRTTGRRR